MLKKYDYLSFINKKWFLLGCLLKGRPQTWLDKPTIGSLYATPIETLHHIFTYIVFLAAKGNIALTHICTYACLYL